MTLNQQEIDGGWLIELAGDADLAALPTLQNALRARREATTPWLVVDFSGVTFVNTPAWAALIEYYQWTQKAGTRLALAGLQGRALLSFETVQLGAFLSHYATVNEAIHAIRPRD